MKIIINNSSQVPIYEQIVDEIKRKIIKEELKADTPLPSVRALATQLRISALTVKKAYDALEREGFVVTVHGKGSFVSNVGSNIKTEELRKEVESDFEKTIRKAKRCGMSDKDIEDLIILILEDM